MAAYADKNYHLKLFFKDLLMTMNVICKLWMMTSGADVSACIAHNDITIHMLLYYSETFKNPYCDKYIGHIKRSFSCSHPISVDPKIYQWQLIWYADNCEWWIVVLMH